MSTVLKLRGGTTAEHDVFTGSAREVTVNTDDNSLRVHDGVTPGGNPVGSATSQWLANSLIPVFVNPTTFTLSGNRTAEFHAGRRVQFLTSAGTVYGTIVASAYSTLTTITMRMDGSSVLDAGLSRAFLGLLRADNIAVPDTVLNVVPLMTGLSGTFNAGTPTTKFDVTSSRVTTISNTGKTKTYVNVGTKTVDITIQGLGGRDQAGAFAAFAEPNLFYVPDGTGGLSVVASLNDFATGPTGYTEFAPIMPHKLNGGAQFYQGILSDDLFTLNTPQQIATGSLGIFPQTFSYANYIPLKAKSWLGFTAAGCNSNGSDGSIYQNVSHLNTVTLASILYLPAGKANGHPFSFEFPVVSSRNVFAGYSNLTNATGYIQTVYVTGWKTKR
jgi:hypothetical protein